MTRGTGVLVYPDKLLESTEFNGDMYIEKNSNGEDFLEVMLKANEDNFQELLEEFNRERFGYAESSLLHEYPHRKTYGSYRKEENSVVLNMEKKTYFDYWFSDYLFVKPFYPTTIIDYDGDEVDIPLEHVTVIHFGKVLYSKKKNGEKNGKHESKER